MPFTVFEVYFLFFQGTFALATTFVTPIALGIAIGFEFLDTNSGGSFCYLSFYGSDKFGDDRFILLLAVGVAAWWLSQMWLCRHIWVPKNLRLERVQGYV